MNRIAPVFTSCRTNRNGRFSRSVIVFAGCGPPQPPVVSPITAVAAAASVPVSSTSMFAWWMTAAMNISLGDVIPEKSAVPDIARVMPSRLSDGTMSARVSTPNRGMNRCTVYG